jgi:Na+/H+ antiporter NhaD/arsenite permease-like protein
MNLAWLSVGALVVAILVSCTTRLNVGLLALAFAWIIGVYFGGMSLADVTSGFPVQLFLTLCGVTLLFSQAQVNGTLERVAHHAVRLCKGHAGLVPMMFFALAATLASVGPGNIATAALIAPMAMASAARAGIPAFLMAIMVANGASAGSLSPFAPTGIIVNGIMARIGMPGLEWPTYYNNALAHTVIAFSGYFVLGGWKLFRRTHRAVALEREAIPDGNPPHPAPDEAPDKAKEQPFEARHWITLATIFVLITSVVFLEVNVGMGAFACAVLLALLRVADHQESIKRMPWAVIMMVSGVTVLIALLEKTQGLDLFVQLLARLTSRDTATAMTAFVTGLISVYSSTSGVVLPAFLPTIPGLIERLGGGDAFAIASSMNVGAHLVDVSPLSTTGALCLAGATGSQDTRDLFNKLLAWGLSMTVVGAVVCYLLFGRG